MKVKERTNAKRFIDAYNEIDYALRIQHGLKRSMGFSDMIRKAVVLNHIVRKYEEDLIDYGRLRNAIIHRSNENFVIAEPHLEVVENIERIAKLLTTPPKVLDKICKRNVLTVQFDVPIKSVIALIARSGFSNLPVYKDGELIGVANGQKILNSIGNYINQNDKNDNINEFLSSTRIEKMVADIARPRFFTVMPADTTVEQAMDVFFKNSKMLVIIITKTGSMNEPPLGILTNSDIMEMSTILENY